MRCQLRTTTAFALLTLFVSGCGSDNTLPPQAPQIEVWTGNSQEGLPGEPLDQPLQVRVSNGQGPIAGVSVVWKVESGNGELLSAGTPTDASGFAQATFRLGPDAGSQSVVATAADVEGEARFTLVATESPAAAVLVATVPVPANYGHHDTFVRDGIAYVLAWNSGIYIYDVGNGMRGGSPSAPALISHFITDDNGVPGGPQVHNAWWFHNPVTDESRYLFVGQEGPATIGVSASGDLHVVDVLDLANPHEVASLRIAGAGVHNLWMDEQRQVLFAAFYNAGVVAIDVSGTLTGDLDSRIIAQTFPGGEGSAYTWGVQLSGNTLYASDMLSGLWAFDPITLIAKQEGGNVTNRFTSDLAISGAVGYTGTWGNRGGLRGNAINVFSLSPTGVPTLSRMVDLPNVGTVSDVGISPDGRYLVATAEGGSGAGLYVFDRSDPLHPVLRTDELVSTGLHTGEVAEIAGRTYVFAAKNPPNPALMIFDITDVIN